VSGRLPVAKISLADVLARWDALAIRWDLDGDERSALLGGFVDGPVDDVNTYLLPAVERRMRLLVELEPVLATVLPSEKCIREWLRRANCNLGSRAPIEVMSCSPDWIRWLIDSLGIAT
jgi:hypothetical protein